MKELIKAKAEGKRIGFASTVGDPFHPGHVGYLLEAKQHCDFLICGLITDPSDRDKHPVQTVFERWMMLSSNDLVDLVIPIENENDLVKTLLVVLPDIRFVGEEYKDKKHTGWNLDIEIHYTKRRHDLSSSELKDRVNYERHKV